jgi:hypothetical protein
MESTYGSLYRSNASTVIHEIFHNLTAGLAPLSHQQMFEGMREAGLSLGLKNAQNDLPNWKDYDNTPEGIRKYVADLYKYEENLWTEACGY